MNSRHRRQCRKRGCEAITRRASRLCIEHAPIVTATDQQGRVRLQSRTHSLITHSLITLTHNEAIDLANQIIDLIETSTETT